MQMTQVSRRRGPAPEFARAQGQSDGRPPLRVLAVGTPAPLEAQVGVQALPVAAFHEISAETLAISLPDVVLSPVVGDEFDCFDLAAVLVEAGFTGRYRAAAVQVPDPGLIRREVAAAFPGLDFDILLLDETGSPDLA